MSASAKWTSAAARRLVEFAKTTSVEAAIEKVASDLLAGLNFPPTHLDLLMPRLGIVRCEADEDFWGSGELRQADDGLEIIYSSHLSPEAAPVYNRSRTRPCSPRQTGPRFPRTGREVERICDMFAAEVLFPRASFMEHSIGPVNVNKVFELAKLFKTSIAATARRYAELNQVSLFEIDDGKIARPNGPINPKRSLVMDSSVRTAIEQAARGQAGEALVFLQRESVVREIILQWKPFATPGRALFVLSPAMFPNNNRTSCEPPSR